MTSILMDGRPIRHPVSGVARYCASLANAMNASGKIDTLDVLVQGGPENVSLKELNEDVSQVHIRHLTQNRKLQNLAMEFLPVGLNMFLPKRYDLIHETYFARLGARTKRCAKISTIHDTIPIDRPDYYSRMNVVFARKNLHRQAREADHLLCDSYYTKERVIELTGASEAKISVIGCGVNQRPLSSIDQDVWPVRGILPKGSRYGLFVSNIEPRKNLETLIKAWPAVLKRDPDLKLVVVGKKNYLAEPILAQGTALLGDSFVYLGSVSEAEKWALLADMETLLFPSFFEGYGIPVIEAYSVSRPALFSRATALTELAIDERQLFDPLSSDEIAAAVLRILDKPEWLVSCCEKAKAFANEQSWEAIAAKIMAVYSRFVSLEPRAQP